MSVATIERFGELAARGAERLRSDRLDRVQAEKVSALAQALADPTRVTIAAALGGAEELCVCDLSWIVERSEKLVSHHARHLRAAGLASSRREGKMVMYSLTDVGRALLGVLERVEVRA